jgi:hypothetical protein
LYDFILYLSFSPLLFGNGFCYLLIRLFFISAELG